MAGSQSVVLGDMPNSTTLVQEMLNPKIDFTGALNGLMTNPSVAGTHQDEFGRYWVMFRFMVDSPNTSSGTTLDLVDLDIVYDYATTIDETDGFDIELNQGVALWTGGATAAVPVAVSSSTGGGVMLSDLSVSSSTGSNTLTLTDNPVGLYPSSDIYEVVTTHAVDPLTGTALGEAWLTFESESGYIKLSWSDFMSFAEASDEHDHINSNPRLRWRTSPTARRSLGTSASTRPGTTRPPFACMQALQPPTASTVSPTLFCLNRRPVMPSKTMQVSPPLSCKTASVHRSP